jgi:DNA mismatch endonuclease (patch repair protein)
VISEVRARTMRAIKSKDTQPEMIVRKLVHSLGYRYRLHRRDLPGVPDLVLPRFRKVIFVHGCFWHGHDCKRGARAPKDNADYWQQKRRNTRERDVSQLASLENAGWQPLVIWECELKNHSALIRKIKLFLDPS